MASSFIYHEQNNHGHHSHSSLSFFRHRCLHIIYHHQQSNHYHHQSFVMYQSSIMCHVSIINHVSLIIYHSWSIIMNHQSSIIHHPSSWIINHQVCLSMLSSYTIWHFGSSGLQTIPFNWHASLTNWQYDVFLFADIDTAQKSNIYTEDGHIWKESTFFKF